MLFTWIVKTCQRHLSRLTWPALLGLFIGQYLLCYLVLRLLRESALVSQLSDFIYYCSVVGSTLGFGDLSPQTAPGRLFTALWQIPVSVGLFGALMGKVIAQVQGMLAKGITGMGDYRHCSGSQKARTRSKKDATPCCVAFYVNYWPECSDLGYG